MGKNIRTFPNIIMYHFEHERFNEATSNRIMNFRLWSVVRLL